MKALRVFNGRLSLDDVPLPSDASQALIRVLKSGICNTDLEIIKGYGGFQGTIGHEFVGIVEEGPAELKGKRVVGEINAGCGECVLCLKGDPRHCARRTVLGIKKRDGCHAEFVQLPAKNLFEVPENVSDDEAVFTEPLAAAFGITEQLEVFSDTKIAVIGDGKLGLLSALCMRLKSDNVSLIGKYQSKLAIAKKRDIETWLPDNILNLARHFDVVIEASGSGSGFAAAMDIIKPRGKLVLKSTYYGSSKWEAWRVVVDEITIIGSRCGRFFPALDLLESRAIEVSDLISEKFRLVDGVKAMQQAGQKGVLKVLLEA